MSQTAAPLADLHGARVLRGSRRQHHDGSHFSRRFDCGRFAGRKIPHRARRWKPHDFIPMARGAANHEVIDARTFANIRLKNQLAPGTEGAGRRTSPAASR